MKNNLFIKKPKKFLIAFLVLFCGLFANEAMGQAQATFTWKTTGGVDNNWTTAGNWTKTGTTLGPDTYPGETPGRRFDIAIVAPGATAVTPVIPARVDAYAVYRLDINNSATVPAGAVVTIDIGATLNVGDQNSNQVRLAGGTLINNGVVNISTTGAGFTSFPATGIICQTPVAIPSVATEYGYKGTGTLSISLPNANFANSACIYSNGTSTNANTPLATYRIELNNPTLSYNQGTTLAIGAIRTLGVTNASHFSPKILISGTGFTVGSVGSPYIGSLIGLGAGTDVTIDSGTTLTFHSISTNTNAVITSFSASAAVVGPPAFTTTTLNLTNKGTINILGASSRSGLNFSTGGTATNRSIITNEGTLNVNLSSSRTTQDGAFSTSDGGGSNLDNTCRLINLGLMNLANPLGSALFASQSFNSPPLIVNNSGTLNLQGALLSGSPTFVNNPNIKGYINNNGLLTSNNELANVVFTNSSAGTLAFVNAAAGATTNALVTGTFATNNGKIQTGSAKLNNLGLIGAYGATSVIEPGGTGKGIADFNKTGSAVVLGKLVVQVDGNATAGTDYDQITNSFLDGGFDVTGATLDVTGISGTATPVDIMLANGVGTIAGPFASVIGLTAGWKVDYTTPGKVQLIYDSGYVAPSVDYVWNGSASSAWTTAANWTPSGLPDQNSAVTIAAVTNQPTISTDANIKSLTIDLGASLTVTGPNLTVKGAITNNGTLTLASNSNLIQIDDLVNGGSGSTIVNRSSNLLRRLDYTSWSSPVTGSQTLQGFSPLTSIAPDIRFYIYNETTNLYNDAVPGNTFETAAGYLIRMPNDHPATATIWNGSFSGVPNNGTINKSITYSGAAFGYNMVGNPYPSTIDAQAFIAANTANIESSLYFWRKINAASGSAYAVYNPMGSTIATPSSALPNGIIQVGQGFFVKAKSASSVDFTNAMRVANNGNQFFKTKQVASKDRVWLNLTNTSGVFSQALIGYTADATTGVDIYDAKYINDSKTALTSNINDEEYTIQGRPAFDATDVVSLMFKTETAGDYTIAIDQVDGVFAAGQDVYLLDSKTGTETDLKAGSYTFAAVAGTDNARFSLKYQRTLKVDAQAFNENSVSVYKNNGTLYVNAGSVTINTIEVYDVQGRLLASQRNVKATTASFNNLRASNQVLIVKIAGEDNSVVTKKVVN